MGQNILARVPVVAGLAYRERVRALPGSFTATLAAEPDNRYFRHAIVVLAKGEKVGYVAPEIATAYFDAVKASPAPVTCPARRAARIDRETSGVELFLDFSGIPVAPSADGSSDTAPA